MFNKEIEKRYVFKPSNDLLEYFNNNYKVATVNYLHINDNSQVRLTFNKTTGINTLTVKTGHGLKRTEYEIDISSKDANLLSEGTKTFEYKYLHFDINNFYQQLTDLEFDKNYEHDYYDVKAVMYKGEEIFIVEKEFNKISDAKNFIIPLDFMNPIDVTENEDYELVNIYKKLFHN